MKLLLIDDDEIDRQLVDRLLGATRGEIEITHAATGQAGLTLFEQTAFDAVLLDFMLPDLTGLEVLERLLADPMRRVAVIVLTGAPTDAGVELRCIEAGAQDFLLKSEISQWHLRRALLHARARHGLEMKLIESREHLRVLAESDSLTGIANRYFFDESLRSVVSRANRTGAQVALLLLDLDNFKLINDNLGHNTGDLMLREVALRLLSVTRESDILCRLGGDEFAIIVPDVGEETSMRNLAGRLLDALKSPFSMAGVELTICASIGVAISPEGGVRRNNSSGAPTSRCIKPNAKEKIVSSFFDRRCKRRLRERRRSRKNYARNISATSWNSIFSRYSPRQPLRYMAPRPWFAGVIRFGAFSARLNFSTSPKNSI